MANNLINNSRVKVKVKKGDKSVSSRRWLERQLNDPYVIAAKNDGYRSRSAYKLIEINEKYNLFKKGQAVVDLGSAPGGWSQVASKFIGSPNKGKIVSIDIQDVEPIEGVIFINGSIMDEEIIKNTKSILKLNLGYSHSIYIKIPDTISIFYINTTTIYLSSFDYLKLNNISNYIKKFRVPEPYKGKGIKFEYDFIKIKEGKKNLIG